MSDATTYFLGKLGEAVTDAHRDGLVESERWYRLTVDLRVEAHLRIEADEFVTFDRMSIVPVDAPADTRPSSSSLG